ncbi:NlpC/P60 family protein [Candidatus Magnetaquicoccus inordinatus]|uniref:NlpC/P60 family protein n=1 Tax=Candidatus Magnetaquicoccus inordinatus TaxID=2496818 RepID=UPI00102C9E4D|nr:NlpC/P60 family protein [Candidatus Magnetaquicoccus inordinatus]
MNSIRDQIVEIAMGWLHTPYHHHARIKGVGVDCVQFLIAVFEECQLATGAEANGYAQDWHLHRSEEKYLQGIQQYARPVVTPEPGDIALFRFGRCVSHAGIVLPDTKKIIHAYAGHGVILSALDGQELAGRLHSHWTVVPS